MENSGTIRARTNSRSSWSRWLPAALLLGVAGCGGPDPLIGDWVMKHHHDNDLHVDGGEDADLVGHGHLDICLTDSPEQCALCKVTFQIDVHDTEGDYTLHGLSDGGCQFGRQNVASLQCTLSDEDARLTCFSGAYEVVYVRK